MNNEINIVDYAENSYLEYAMSVVKGRAIASVEDGCKPVHRRIIYSMYKMGITAAGLPTKSARITGDVIGKYHPHGDTAVYEAMVNMSQKFRMRYPVVMGEGNFGSRDGDGAAAQRYTECKFYPMSKIMFEELNEDAVDFVPNYDGKDLEPRILPARLPMILLNATEGIGVGMATNIPSHNMREVVSGVIAYLNNPDIQLDEMLGFIRGPDFPTGCQLISSSAEIKKVYEEGRGSFRLRAKYYIENQGSKNWKIVFNEIPYGVSVRQLLEEINALLNPEIKAKKDAKGKIKVGAEALKLKQVFANLIGDFRDDSDKENPVRLVISPRSYKQSPEELVQILLGSTSLESNFSANFVVVGLDGSPRQKPLLHIIKEWSEFRLKTIERRCNFHIEKLIKRIHILEGRKKVLENILDVMLIVKDSNNPKNDLQEKYGLSDDQAQDVIELRLRQLGNLELATIEKEYQEANAKKTSLEKIVATDKALKKQMIKELEQDSSEYADDRLTELCAAQKADSSVLQEKSSVVLQEDITLVVSQKGWVKSIKGKKERSEIQMKEGDAIDYSFFCKNTDTLCIFDEGGKIYNASINEITKDGAPLASLIQASSKIAIVCPINKEHKYFLSQSSGYGMVVSGESLTTRMKAGKEMMKIVDDGVILQPLYFKPEDADKELALITSDKKMLVFNLSDVPEIGKGKGVTLCSLSKGAVLISTKLINRGAETIIKDDLTGEVVVVFNDGDLDRYRKSRATKGTVVHAGDGATIMSFVQ